MQIGIGLPNPIPGASGHVLRDWARLAEQRGFSTLATIDRIAYPSYESLIALAAAAAMTERVTLLTNVLLGPTRNPALLAKEAASVDQISGGRLILGLSVGGRKDDFDVAGQPFEGRGRRWNEDLEIIHRAWSGEPVAGSPVAVTPTPVNGGRVPVLIGGAVDEAVERAIKWGIGWTAGGSPPETAEPFVRRIRAAWRDAGREGEPRIVGLAYFALGPNAEEGATAYIKDYYSYLGGWEEQMAQGIPRTPEALRDTARRFEEAGFDELIYDPTIAELDQVDRLADAVLGNR